MVQWGPKVTKDNKETQEAKVHQVSKEDQVLLGDQADQEPKVKWDQRDFQALLEEMGYWGDQDFLDHLDQLESLVRMEIKAKLVYLVKKASKEIKGLWVLQDL